MSSEPSHNPAAAEELGEKKLSKKELAKLERLRKRQEAAAAAATSVAALTLEDEDRLAVNYGEIPANDLQSKAVIGRKLMEVKYLTKELKDKAVQVQGYAQAIRAVGKKMAFLVVREESFTVQCVLTVAQDLVSPQMVKFANSLSRESIVDIEGIVSVPSQPITGASQQVEIQVRKLYCVSKAVPILPFNIEDAARSEAEIEKALQAGEPLVRVNPDTRLNNRFFDLRTPANQGIFGVESEVENIFRQFMLSEGFCKIHTPTLTAGSSEGGAAVFRLDYFGKPACLAQSPQLFKQMAISGGFSRVFAIGPVFRAENSSTHRHLCEFIGLDVEMRIEKHYSEVMDIVDCLFVEMFDRLNERCAKELEFINKQYAFENLKYLRKTLRLTFEEGVQMLKEAGIEIDPFGDLNTETERKLGQLVLDKYGTEFYILYRFPLAVRPFYTMPCPDNPKYSNSFDVFLRGEEIISGAQRIHEPEFLAERARACGIDVNTISTYLDSFRYEMPPHGGFGVGLERVAMLFCALDNIRKTSLFPRDPRRIFPHDPIPPFTIEDTARSEAVIENTLQVGDKLFIDNRVLDLRASANQGIFRVKCQVDNIIFQFLVSESFRSIHTPKLNADSGEGGANVFRLDYFGTPACLAQSTQAYKQMAVCGGFSHVFEIGPLYNAEVSSTHRHLCESIGLDVEMRIEEHYSEVMDIVDRLFVEVFDRLNERCTKELEAVNEKYPFENLKYLRKTLRLTFEEGVQMLKEASIEVDPFRDLNAETQRKLGQLVLKKYGTEFYILHRYPLAVRPFYTMPCQDNSKYSNSFDVFIRGEKVISGGQHIHEQELLAERARACGINVNTISTYTDCFRYGAAPQGGFGVELERVVMLFCALDDIHKASLFPRDPQILEP
ncbi:aspartate--tRNA ligase 1, cytoplasmic-like [Salvia miltiorrhiza]|uniref:aspartate--tRNA ligase 1, cytoplasmic-like n=1 Tax=Salvia miltiorrhiza TaxID=226208 RepID=UPI0025AC882A|nr:aspartate--tRNA ligase 1, cytoplasmic-like [Salvia miltiorrhiza]XP_057802068.1 aspartate--tRNA ligase 1, cytoplasmic-like [Salvia miltiorrhiza]XP_057802070.1 aspartate--tRNA ligase 1, cytoplasmic-like [Salvia miltiorrhiza]XP_057802071.1 aspartate--tRNA ligase 1, cytoplasmic-like [Salvia miltiorrhiza]XP_057802072.1 aspartate--tRNA ligase 1, cytoplasmic-like [Salvia miltiorrhiza]XP_057802073.1 aspartate--tRNA ligase 1, cytoplasmic-like [Salvia miltiorrhiza]